MERLLRAALAATMSILLVAGGSLAVTQAGPDDLVTLQAAPWTLSELDGQSVDASAGITAVFGADESLTGSAGCNAFTGDYTTEGATLTVTPLAATRKACEPDVMDNENLYLDLLQNAATWSLDGATLTITSADSGVLVFGGEGSAEPAPFQGTEWTLQSITGQDVASVGATAVFADDFTVSGFGGCNQYNGPWSLDQDTIAIGPLAATRKACAQDVMDTENAFLNAMESVDAMAITGQTLTLSASDQSAVLVFSATGGSTTGGDVTLTGTAWLVTDIDGDPAIATDNASVTFGTDGTITGFGGCNQLFGDYAADGSTLTVTGLAATRKFCDADLMDREGSLITTLQGAASFEISGSDLTVTASDGTTVGLTAGVAGPIPSEPPPPTPEPVVTPEPVASPVASTGELVGPTWVLTELMGQPMPGAVVHVTITFDQDGTITGNGGCTDYTGTYTVDGAKITIAGITPATGSCDDTSKSIQDGLLQVLPFMDGWSIVDGDLHLDSSFGINTVWAAS